jgi:hypothetical protein
MGPSPGGGGGGLHGDDLFTCETKKENTGGGGRDKCK